MMKDLSHPPAPTTQKTVLPLPQKIRDGRLSELLERVPYLSEAVSRVTYDPDLHAVEVIHASEADTEVSTALTELVDVLLASRIKAQKEERTNLDQMAGPSEIHTFCQSEFAGPSGIAAMEALDRAVCEIAAKVGADLRRYPSVYDAETMHCCGYHKNFPQNVYGITRIPHDYAVIRQIRDDDSPDIDPTLFVSDGDYLQPCICYHCYEEWRGTKMDTAILSAAGRCFRHEIKWKLDEFRRNEFTMREIVFLGDAITQPEVWKLS